MPRTCCICNRKFSSKTSEVCSPHCEEIDAEIRAAMVKRVNEEGGSDEFEKRCPTQDRCCR
jgi:hypothetical protein